MKNKFSKDERIRELEEEIIQLKKHIIISENDNKRIIQGIYDSKNRQIEQLLQNPIITFPSGSQIAVQYLNEEQLAYLESLAVTKQKLK